MVNHSRYGNVIDDNLIVIDDGVWIIVAGGTAPLGSIKPLSTPYICGYISEDGALNYSGRSSSY